MPHPHAHVLSLSIPQQSHTGIFGKGVRPVAMCGASAPSLPIRHVRRRPTPSFSRPSGRASSSTQRPPVRTAPLRQPPPGCLRQPPLPPRLPLFHPRMPTSRTPPVSFVHRPTSPLLQSWLATGRPAPKLQICKFVEASKFVPKLHAKARISARLLLRRRCPPASGSPAGQGRAATAVHLRAAAFAISAYHCCGRGSVWSARLAWR